MKWENNEAYKTTYIHSVKFNKTRDNKFLAVARVNKPLLAFLI